MRRKTGSRGAARYCHAPRVTGVVVGPASATVLGWIYVALRASYPWFLGPRLGRNIPRRLLINTFSGYAVLAVLAGWTALRLF